jgi:hypothetical protein
VPKRSAPRDTGSTHLLWDCANVGRLLEGERPSARERLQSELGEELAEALLASLGDENPAAAAGQSDAA